jgi:hypothetical protein
MVAVQQQYTAVLHVGWHTYSWALNLEVPAAPSDNTAHAGLQAVKAGVQPHVVKCCG